MSFPTFPEPLEVFGFSAKKTGGHMSRSMMFDELGILENRLPASAVRADYKTAIEDNNILGKPTLSSRQKSYRHLIELYGLDPGYALFRGLRTIGIADGPSLPLIAATCVYCRDPQLRASFELLQSISEGQEITRPEMERCLEDNFPGRYSPAMKKSLAQNVNTTWTVSGHLNGRAKKMRTLPRAGYGAVCFAMFAGWLSGLRGDLLMNSVFAKLVNSNSGTIVPKLREGATHRWLRLRSGGGVTEIDFSPLLTDKELPLLYDAA